MNISAKNYHTLINLELLLRITYGLLFIVAGIDKFFYSITVWSKYISPFVVEMLPFHPVQFILGVGIFEIILGALILTIAPRIGAYIASFWLFIIAINLVTMGMYYDIAVRDIVMAVGAFVLAGLTHVVEIVKPAPKK